MCQRSWRGPRIVGAVAVILRSVTRTCEFDLLIDLAPPGPDLLRLVQTLHLHRAPQMGARSRDAVQSVFLPKDEHALVFDEFCAFVELIERPDFEALRILVENVWDKSANQGVRLSPNTDNYRA